VAEIWWHNAHGIAALDERRPIEHYMGHTLNISALCTYSFYDYCWFGSSEEGFPDQQRVPGHWLGVSLDISGPLTYFVLPKSCWPIAGSSVTPVTPEELLESANKVMAEELDTFDKYLAAEVLLPHGGELVRVKVTGRKLAADGMPVAAAHSNPIVDTRQYKVSFPDMSADKYTANMIA
jgi:hypothetical protein